MKEYCKQSQEYLQFNDKRYARMKIFSFKYNAHSIVPPIHK